jgi:Lon protease-like protein
MRASIMNVQLPYFPLHVVAFPHLPLPLQIFEPRYRAMTRDILAEESPYAGRFVVSMITSGHEAGDAETRTQPIGTICEVRTAEQLADGRYILLTVGVGRARLGRIDRSGEYALVETTPLEESDGSPEAVTLLPTVQSALDAYMEAVKRFVAATASVGHESEEINNVAASLDEVLKPIRLPDDPLAASYAVGGVLQIELNRKQQLLELPDAASRLRAELDLLRRESRLLAEGAMPPIASADLTYHPN